MRKGFYLILILLFPSIIFMIFSLGEHHVTKMGSYGSYRVLENGDTLYRPIQQLDLIDQDGQPISIDSLRGKPILFDFFSNPCDEPCMKKGVTLVNYLNDAPDREKWELISVSLDPEISIDELKRLQQLHLPEMENWHFAVAKNDMQLRAFVQYAFVMTQKAENFDALPSNYFMLVDQQGVIREFLDSRIHKENKKMQDAIKLVLKEPFMTWKETKK